MWCIRSWGQRYVKSNQIKSIKGICTCVCVFEPNTNEKKLQRKKNKKKNSNSNESIYVHSFCQAGLEYEKICTSSTFDWLVHCCWMVPLATHTLFQHISGVRALISHYATQYGNRYTYKNAPANGFALHAIAPVWQFSSAW